VSLEFCRPDIENKSLILKMNTCRYYKQYTLLPPVENIYLRCKRCRQKKVSLEFCRPDIENKSLILKMNTCRYHKQYTLLPPVENIYLRCKRCMKKPGYYLSTCIARLCIYNTHYKSLFRGRNLRDMYRSNPTM